MKNFAPVRYARCLIDSGSLYKTGIKIDYTVIRERFACDMVAYVTVYTAAGYKFLHYLEKHGIDTYYDDFPRPYNWTVEMTLDAVQHLNKNDINWVILVTENPQFEELQNVYGSRVQIFGVKDASPLHNCTA